MPRLQVPVTPQWHRAPEPAVAEGPQTSEVLAGRPLPAQPPAPVAGGEAWIVAHEPGAPVWMSASAPQIAVTDQRLRATRAR